MSRKRKSVRVIGKNCKKFTKKFILAIKKQILWLLRVFVVSKRKRASFNAGFVLPTVAMVGLVVVLLTTAILFRSFERSRNASNVRVNEVVLKAVDPAIDRARAKLDALFEDPTLPRGTPSDTALYDALRKDKYRLGDETRLKIAEEFNNNGGIQERDEKGKELDVEKQETIRSAWKFPIDTDNDGKFDTFTLYGIYFRSPERNTSGNFSRPRNALEARTPPMDADITNQQCVNAAGFSSLVGNSSWYKLQSGNLGKSFFVYAVNVPITKADIKDQKLDTNKYDDYKGNKGFAALEFQQDRSRIPLPNHAVWFENDLEITPGEQLDINGRIHTNGNLLVGGGKNVNVTFRQVSSISSCFYNQENGLITVGGNVGTGSVVSDTNQSAVKVEFYQGFNKKVTNDEIKEANKSTNSPGGSKIAFNDTAYSERIKQMKEDAFTYCTTCFAASVTNGAMLKAEVEKSSYPKELQDKIKELVKDDDDDSTAKQTLRDQIEVLLRNRTRRVPFDEVPGTTGKTATLGYIKIGANLIPPEDWRVPLDSSNNLTGTSVKILTDQLKATWPDLQKRRGTQSDLGDRIFVGNNLPATWLKKFSATDERFVGSEEPQELASTVKWTEPKGANAKTRWRNTQVQALAELGLSDRNGFWEKQAVEYPKNPLDSVGGVRIVTGAGIYVDGTGSPNALTGPFYPRQQAISTTNPSASAGTSFLSEPLPPSGSDIYVWPDTMPMSSPNASETRKGDLLMRATAVYHYNSSSGDNQTPIACVSSYYDPTNSETARNRTGGPINNDTKLLVGTSTGRSNNGIVYAFPGRDAFETNRSLLKRQTNLRFPNGRYVNQTLREAFDKLGSSTLSTAKNLELADYSAIDTALCAITILKDELVDGTLNSYLASTANLPPHGAIKESSFLDGREIKQAGLPGTANYDLDLEQRQPLEVRVTDIDLRSLAKTTVGTTKFGTTEFLLPNSGIIFATREDALRDASNPDPIESALLSPTDFIVDPTRRPNGIRLINGETLARDPGNRKNKYFPEEKGLILVSNLPAYIRGTFNLHRTSTAPTAAEIQEFEQTNLEGEEFYKRSTPNKDFACRVDRPGCSPPNGGDYWRPATIIADAMTLQSGGFIDGFRNQGDYDLNNNTGSAIPADLNNNPRPTTFAATEEIRRKRLKNGFWENNYATSTDWYDPKGTAATATTPKTEKNYPKRNIGSYALNGVTPIQRRVSSFPLYVMEICRKELVSECTPSDWVVGFDIDGDGLLSSTSTEYTIKDSLGKDTTIKIKLTEDKIKAYQLGQAVAASEGYKSSVLDQRWNSRFGKGANKTVRERLGAGDTGSVALRQTDRSFPRRVAFARNASDKLVSTTSPTGSLIYQPLGVGCKLRTTPYTASTGDTEYLENGCIYGGTSQYVNYGSQEDNALWFRTTDYTNSDPGTAPTDRNDRPLFYYPPIDPDGQPLLVPVLQIHDAGSSPKNSAGELRTDAKAGQKQFHERWLQSADADTTFNGTFVIGNTPSRPNETPGGLQNLLRFLETWEVLDPNDKAITRKVTISGSFIQLKRSSFATAPIASIARDKTPINTVNLTNPTNANANFSLFDYPLDAYSAQNVDGASPFYQPPVRQWGFDVGLLSEQPDLFAQRFTAPSVGRPNEFFREVGRDDPWVNALLCAGQANNLTGVVESGKTVTYSPAISPDGGYRPNCDKNGGIDKIPPN